MGKSINNNSVFPNDQSSSRPFGPDNFSEEEILISKTIERFVEDQVTPELDALEAYDYKVTERLFKEVGELGLLGVDVPEAFGGLEMGKKTSGLIAETMGYGASFSVAFNIHAGVGTLPYVYFGTDEQKEAYLPKLASGEWVGAYALTEPNAGSDALAAKTSAVFDEDTEEWVLNGEKQWITNAHVANVYVVFARSSEGMTCFIVERTAPGISIGPEEHKLGIRGTSTATLILDNARIPKDNVLGVNGKGHHIALNILNLARLKLAFSNVGATKQSLGVAVQYGKERQQFQRDIVSFPMIQEKIANIAVSIYGAESSTYYTADLLDEVDVIIKEDGDPVKNLSIYAMDCAINKVYASEALDYAVDESLQIHGGYGYMEEYVAERQYRDARINRLFEGTNEINRLTIAKTFLEKYYKDNSILEEDLIDGLNRNQIFTQSAVYLLEISLKNIAEINRKEMDNEQEFLRLVADIVMEIYVMRASLTRANNAKTNDPVRQDYVDVLCEEGYRKVEMSAVSIISSMIEDDTDRETLLNEMKDLSIPLYSNLVLKKRTIAEKLIKNDGY